MKEIEKLLREYRIRFRDTEKIEKKTYPFEAWEISDEERFDPYIDREQIVNRYGKVYDKGVWAIADVKIKPEKCVVKKDTQHKSWDEFREHYKDVFTRYDFNVGNYFAIDENGGWVSNDITVGK